MIIAFIFAAHILFALIIFTKEWQDESLSSAFLNIALIGILFSVGWTLTNLIAQLIMEPKGFGIYFDRDTFSLTLLTIIEFLFYRMYYKNLFIEADKEKQ